MSDETKRKKSARKKPSSKKASAVAKKVDETALSETAYDPTATDEGVKAVCDTLKAEPLPHTEPITADEIVNAMPQKVLHREDRVTCCVCGHSTPRKLAFIVNGDKYVCSKRCLSRYATARPRF